MVAAGHAAPRRSSAARSRTRRSPTSTSAPRSRRRTSSPSSPGRLRRRAGLAALRLAGHAGHGQPRPPVGRRRGGQPRRRGRRGDRRAQQGRRAGRRRTGRRRLRPAARRARHGGGGRPGRRRPLPRPPATPTTSFHFVFDAGEAGTGSEHRPGVRRRRGRRQPPVRPAAADPGVHGAALGRRPAAGRQLHDVVLHPDPAHPAGDAGDDHRHPGAQAAGDRPGRRRRLRRQAAGHARRRSSACWWPAGSASRSSGPRRAASR